MTQQLRKREKSKGGGGGEIEGLQSFGRNNRTTEVLMGANLELRKCFE